MILNRENLFNAIEDDLNARNTNWETIEDKLNEHDNNLSQITNNVNTMGESVAGLDSLTMSIVTMPAIKIRDSRVSFPIAKNTLVQIGFQDPIYDFEVDSGPMLLDQTNPLFELTIPRNGIYLLWSSIRFENARTPDKPEIQMYKGGSRVALFKTEADNNGATFLTGTSIIAANAGDVLTLHAKANTTESDLKISLYFEHTGWGVVMLRAL